jgi:hypothetical protein
MKFDQHEGRIVKITTQLKDNHGSSTEQAKDVMRVFASVMERHTECAGDTYFISIRTGEYDWRYTAHHCDDHYEALAKALENIPVTNGDVGECVVVGPCGFDDCRCDGEPYAMRWTFSAHSLTVMPLADA